MSDPLYNFKDDVCVCIYYEREYVGIAEKDCRDCSWTVEGTKKSSPSLVAAKNAKPNKTVAFAVHVLIAFLITGPRVLLLKGRTCTSLSIRRKYSPR